MKLITLLLFCVNAAICIAHMHANVVAAPSAENVFIPPLQSTVCEVNPHDIPTKSNASDTSYPSLVFHGTMCKHALHRYVSSVHCTKSRARAGSHM